MNIKTIKTINQLTLKNYEAHHASLCVATVYGGIGGALGHYSGILLLLLLLGCLIPWVVCFAFFPTAHRWYNAKTHLLYNAFGMVSALGVYNVLRLCG